MNQSGTSHEPAPKELREKVVRLIRDQGLTVSQAAIDCGYSTKAIYRWLKEGVVNTETSLILENNRLKKEVDQLYAMLGRATAEMQRPKR